jgi:hypothetical protein
MSSDVHQNRFFRVMLRNEILRNVQVRIRCLIHLWSARRLAASLRTNRTAFERGEGKELRSLEDLA